MEISEPITVFLSYVSEDREVVSEVYDLLEHHGFDVWMDKKRLKGGQNWDYEIRRAFDRSQIVVAFISQNSIRKRGYAQREISFSLRKLEEKLSADIYLVPVSLDDVERPDILRALQFISATDHDWMQQVVESIRHQAKLLGASEIPESSSDDILKWRFQQISERYDGAPGYEIDRQLIHLSSSEYDNVGDVSALISGDLADLAMNQRRVLLEKDSHSSILDPRSRRISTTSVFCNVVSRVGSILSVGYTHYWYGAGAAHPNHGFRCYSFFLMPLCQIGTLGDVVEEESLDRVTDLVRKSLRAQRSADEEVPPIGEEWLLKGTSELSFFCNFLFRDSGLELLFAPYEIDCYAAGSYTVELKYETITEHLRPDFIRALGLYHEKLHE